MEIAGLISFLKHSISTYHICDYIEEILKSKGFARQNQIPISKAGDSQKLYFRINDTMIIVITIPVNPKYIRIIGTHNDSPVLKIKPETITSNRFSMLPYGGGLWHTWFDRPLGIAGVAYTADMKRKLINMNYPVAFIPSLPPHLNNGEVYNKGFKYNSEQQLNSCMDNTRLLKQLEGTVSYDLNLYDLQGPEMVNHEEETSYVICGKCDNLLSSYVGLQAIVDATSVETINILGIFDHEEIGSMTNTGAKCSAFVDIFKFLKKTYSIANENSFLVSADAAHGFNKNYPSHFSENSPELGNGTVIKYSPKYCTNAYSEAFIKQFHTNFQTFVLRNDIQGGSTIGPMLTAALGIQGIDIGTPILSMHSIKEMCHFRDVLDLYALFHTFYSKI